MNLPQAEGNVNSRLYSRERILNKFHEEYGAWYAYKEYDIILQ